MLVPSSSDDGGLSGGTPERPALQRLLADIREGCVEIVVYKVGRLTRSLADFARLAETFGSAGASFVSVTQAFNTSTSLGRLTLNMLLSSARFKHEVTAERICDKIAASKRKGMRMGGPVPLGYDAVDRRLAVSEAQARTVRHIYRRYLALGSIRQLKAELGRDGIVSKAGIAKTGEITKTGERLGGVGLVPGALRIILRNPLHVGEVQHKGERFPGQHEANLDRPIREAMRERLERQRRQRRCSSDARAASPLASMPFDPARTGRSPRRMPPSRSTSRRSGAATSVSSSAAHGPAARGESS